MKIWYYQCDGGYAAITSECPKGFRGVVYVGRGTPPGGGLADILEQGYAADRLKKMRPVAKAQVPPEWVAGLGYENPEPQPVEAVEEEEIPILDDDGESLQALITLPVRRPVRRQADDRPLPSDEIAFVAGLIIAIVVGLFLLAG